MKTRSASGTSVSGLEHGLYQFIAFRRFEVDDHVYAGVERFVSRANGFPGFCTPVLASGEMVIVPLDFVLRKREAGHEQRQSQYQSENLFHDIPPAYFFLTFYRQPLPVQEPYIFFQQFNYTGSARKNQVCGRSFLLFIGVA